MIDRVEYPKFTVNVPGYSPETIDRFVSQPDYFGYRFIVVRSDKPDKPLVGRQLTHTLYPLLQLEPGATETYLQTKGRLIDRLIFGSYPDVVGAETDPDRIDYPKGMVSSYLLKGILLFKQRRNTRKMLRLLQLVAYQVGNEVLSDISIYFPRCLSSFGWADTVIICAKK